MKTNAYTFVLKNGVICWCDKWPEIEDFYIPTGPDQGEYEYRAYNYFCDRAIEEAIPVEDETSKVVLRALFKGIPDIDLLDEFQPFTIQLPGEMKVIPTGDTKIHTFGEEAEVVARFIPYEEQKEESNEERQEPQWQIWSDSNEGKGNDVFKAIENRQAHDIINQFTITRKPKQ